MWGNFSKVLKKTSLIYCKSTLSLSRSGLRYGISSIDPFLSNIIIGTHRIREILQCSHSLKFNQWNIKVIILNYRTLQNLIAWLIPALWIERFQKYVWFFRRMWKLISGEKPSKYKSKSFFDRILSCFSIFICVIFTFYCRYVPMRELVDSKRKWLLPY